MCDCDVGAIDEVCDAVTGSCVCASGVVGYRCEECELYHYGLSVKGCSGEFLTVEFYFECPKR